MENNKILKSDVRNKAVVLKKQIMKYVTAFLIGFWGFILKKFNQVSIALQAVDINVMQVIEYYKSLIILVEKTRNKFDKFEEKANEICLGEASFENKNRRKITRKLQAGENRENELKYDERFKFIISVFLPIIDSLLSDLKIRLEAYLNFAEKFSFLLNVAEMKEEDISKTITILTQRAIQKTSPMKRNLRMN